MNGRLTVKIELYAGVICANIPLFESNPKSRDFRLMRPPSGEAASDGEQHLQVQQQQQQQHQNDQPDTGNSQGQVTFRLMKRGTKGSFWFLSSSYNPLSAHSRHVSISFPIETNAN